MLKTPIEISDRLLPMQYTKQCTLTAAVDCGSVPPVPPSFSSPSFSLASVSVVSTVLSSPSTVSVSFPVDASIPVVCVCEACDSGGVGV